MDTLKAITRRKSVRSYRQDQITDEVLNAILSAGCAAPVASGKYDSLHLTVVQDKNMLKRISDSVDKALKAMNIKSVILHTAPTMILVSSEEPHMPGIEYANAGCVLENMVIAATDQNVDSVLFGAAAMAVRSNDELRKALAIPDGFNPLLSVALGYTAVPDEIAKEHKLSINRV
jgi:nitroreductase